MNNQLACLQGIGNRVKSWQDLDGLVKNKSNSILKHFKCAAKKSILMGTAALAPVAFAQTASAQINQTIDASAGQSCIDTGGAIVGPNIFTAADNGTFGTGSGAPDEFVASNIFAPQVSGGTYRNSFSPYSHGSFSYVSNQVTRRNNGQFNGTQIDPVYGVAGNFMVSDPSDQSPTLDHQLTGLAPGTAYEISFWVADTEYGNGAKQRIAVDIDGSQEFITPFINSNGNGNANNPVVWQKHSYVYTHSNAATTALASVRFNETGAAGRDVFLDNIEMRECQFGGNPSMTLTKVADDATDRSTNHAITYTYTVENTGDVNIEDVSISDDHTSAAGTVSLPVSGESGDAGNSTDSSDTTANDGIWDVLAPGDIITFTSSYTVTSADVNLGNDLTNIATVTGTPTTGAFGPDPITASESVSLFVPTLYPVTPQPVGVCTVDTLVYGENFDDGSNGGFSAVSQPANAPVGLLESTNNFGNINNTITDATIHPDLNGGAGAPSPSGGGFAVAFDAQGGEPTWVASVGTQDWSSLIDGGISFEFWNYYPNRAVSNYNDQVLYFQIIGDNGKLVLDLDISTYAATLLAGNWITIEALFDTAEPWFFTTNTNVRSESGLAPATPADFATVLASVNSVAIAPESGGGGNYNAPGIDQLLNIERYGVDTIQAFSCAIPANPQLTLSKVADDDADRAVDDVITYTYTVENTGDVNIEDVTVSDQHTSASGTSALPVAGETGDAGNSASSTDAASNGSWDVLAPGDSVTFTSTYTVTTADAAAGVDITNAATATGVPASGTLTDPTATESVSLAAVAIDAIDDDFTSSPIDPDAGGVTATIFSNDTLGGAAFANSDITVSLLDDGQIYGATLNPDGTINVPAGTAPGIYQVEYEICEATDPDNCDTAIATVAVQANTPDIIDQPETCGEFVSQGWITYGVLGLFDPDLMIGSGDVTNDPYQYLPIQRDADGRIVSYFGAPDDTMTGSIPGPMSNELAFTNLDDANHNSEYHRYAIRVEGVPGATEVLDFDTIGGFEWSAYWVEDSAGNVLAQSDFVYTAPAGVGQSLPISFTMPSDGIAYINGALIDPTQAYGKPRLKNHECPLPELTISKVADNDTDRKLGDNVTYTYTVENTGNVNIDDVTIDDQHTSSSGTSTLPVAGETGDAGNSASSTDATANDGSWDVLAPGDSVNFIGTYVVTEADVLNGGDLTNIATVTGDPVAGSLPTDPISADEAVSVAPLDVDISITKTNTPGVNGEVDQAADTLTSGDMTTYTLVVTNNGPDTVTGAVVTDTVGTGLTCTSTDTVTITGDGVPSGSFTIGDLTGGGITLETLADGESATLTYTCEVN